MKLAMEWAEKGRGFTKTNPLVGAILVKEGEIVGRGYHRAFGEDHAEVMALKEAGENAKGATIYVTLEPCCHYGKTPPCTEALIRAGVKKVVIGMLDVDVRVAGRGAEILRNHGIAVEVGLLEKELRFQNRMFLVQQREKRPYVVLKFASSLDGKIATKTGESQWITSEESRLDGHGLRGMLDGILVGTETVLQDNPTLNNRSGSGKNPIKIFLDRRGKIPLDSQVFAKEKEMALVVTDRENLSYQRVLEEKNISYIGVSSGKEGLNLREMLEKLYEKNVGSLLIEGGGTVHGSFVSENLFDEVYAYIAPKLIGGEGAKSAVSGRGLARLSQVEDLEIYEIKNLGSDIRIHGGRKCLREL